MARCPHGPGRRWPPRPVAVEYATLGKTVRERVDALLAWSAAHEGEIEAARDRFDLE
ncbi:hypothetical protein M3148_13775 [Georgenia satyanarayanai]|uniref:hypothetical protein n=1 Tax=Georgenia satyanarayanai TaxID=860221 RepID=UPI00203DEBD2|nr:hypothetical protein [Georgenia satyanarayanai]MCM3662052.1 hypothetical protein [Georgenia satyanarayanai]